MSYSHLRNHLYDQPQKYQKLQGNKGRLSSERESVLMPGNGGVCVSPQEERKSQHRSQEQLNGGLYEIMKR